MKLMANMMSKKTAVKLSKVKACSGEDKQMKPALETVPRADIENNKGSHE